MHTYRNDLLVVWTPPSYLGTAHPKGPAHLFGGGVTQCLCSENRVTAQPDFMVKHLGFLEFHVETQVQHLDFMGKHGGGVP